MQLIWKIVLISAQSALIAYPRLLPHDKKSGFAQNVAKRFIPGFELYFIDENLVHAP